MIEPLVATDTEVNELLNRLAEAEGRAKQYAQDNANLRQSLANYMLATDGGQAAIKEFRVMALSASIAAQQAELDRLNG